MKTVIINASPRKKWNTGRMLREAERGAQVAGSETEYIDLYDLDFTGCRSYLACKRKGAERNRCYWKDDLSPVIERILSADALIIGSPIYFGQPTARFRALLERLAFCTLSYDTGPAYYQGKVDIGFIYTMNAPREYYENGMRDSLKGAEATLARLLNGTMQTVRACNTVQVSDYSLYSMGRFSAEDKKEYRQEHFADDLEAAYQLGAALGR